MLGEESATNERRVLFLRFRSEHFTNTHTSCRRFPPSAREEMRSREVALPGTPPGFLLVPHVDMYNCCLGIKYMSYHPQSAIRPVAWLDGWVRCGPLEGRRSAACIAWPGGSGRRYGGRRRRGHARSASLRSLLSDDWYVYVRFFLTPPVCLCFHASSRLGAFGQLRAYAPVWV